MKANTLWVLISGLAVGFLIGRELPRGGGSAKDTTTSETSVAAAGPTNIPADWIKEDDLKATDKFAGLTPAQRFTVLKVMNEKPCDCGCPHGNTAKCMKEDPACPRAPIILNKAIELAKAGKGFDAILAEVKTKDAPAAAAPSPNQKVEVAKWTPIEGPKLAKVTIVEFSDFQ